MRLCDRDTEAWLDEGRLSINPRPPVERINGATVMMYAWAINFVPSVVTRQRLSI
ncbi:hypothetical protein ACVXHA_16065 [Escherichia coli]